MIAPFQLQKHTNQFYRHQLVRRRRSHVGVSPLPSEGRPGGPPTHRGGTGPAWQRESPHDRSVRLDLATLPEGPPLLRPPPLPPPPPFCLFFGAGVCGPGPVFPASQVCLSISFAHSWEEGGSIADGMVSPPRDSHAPPNGPGGVNRNA